LMKRGKGASLPGKIGAVPKEPIDIVKLAEETAEPTEVAKVAEAPPPTETAKVAATPILGKNWVEVPEDFTVPPGIKVELTRGSKTGKLYARTAKPKLSPQEVYQSSVAENPAEAMVQRTQPPQTQPAGPIESLINELNQYVPETEPQPILPLKSAGTGKAVSKKAVATPKQMKATPAVQKPAAAVPATGKKVTAAAPGKGTVAKAQKTTGTGWIEIPEEKLVSTLFENPNAQIARGRNTGKLYARIPKALEPVKAATPKAKVAAQETGPTTAPKWYGVKPIKPSKIPMLEKESVAHISKYQDALNYVAEMKNKPLSDRFDVAKIPPGKTKLYLGAIDKEIQSYYEGLVKPEVRDQLIASGMPEYLADRLPAKVAEVLMKNKNRLGSVNWDRLKLGGSSVRSALHEAQAKAENKPYYEAVGYQPNEEGARSPLRSQKVKPLEAPKVNPDDIVAYAKIKNAQPNGDVGSLKGTDTYKQLETTWKGLPKEARNLLRGYYNDLAKPMDPGAYSRVNEVYNDIQSGLKNLENIAEAAAKAKSNPELVAAYERMGLESKTPSSRGARAYLTYTENLEPILGLIRRLLESLPEEQRPTALARLKLRSLYETTPELADIIKAAITYVELENTPKGRIMLRVYEWEKSRGKGKLPIDAEQLQDLANQIRFGKTGTKTLSENTSSKIEAVVWPEEAEYPDLAKQAEPTASGGTPITTKIKKWENVPTDNPSATKWIEEWTTETDLPRGRRETIAAAEKFTGLKIIDMGNTTTREITTALRGIVGRTNEIGELIYQDSPIIIGHGTGIGADWTFKGGGSVNDVVKKYGGKAFVIACDDSKLRNFATAEGKLVDLSLEE
jgi:hypothetical protein